jgi:hypothetical protein
MIFKNWQAVITRSQTQMRCLRKPGEDFLRQANGDLYWPHSVVNTGGDTVYSTFKTYPVEPSPNHPAIIYNPDHPCYGIDIIEPGDNHYQYAKDGTWSYKGQGYYDACIRFTDIGREDIRHISVEDAQAEGYAHRWQFWAAWCEQHDAKALIDLAYTKSTPRGTLVGINYERLLERPAARYQAWIFTFDLVES